MKTDRLLGLLSILANTEKITVQELAERFEVSKRTIFRDLDTLSCAGIPILSYPGIGGGVSVVEGYKFKNQILSTDETEKIFIALKGLKSIDNNHSITSLIAKLVPGDEEMIFSQSDYVIDLSSWFDDSTIHEKSVQLHQAISQQKCVRIEYVSKSSRLLRVIEPHKLIFKQSHWYLYAFCQEKNDFRLFRLNRIISLELLEEGFQMRPVNRIEFEKIHSEPLFFHDDREGLTEVVLEYDISKEFELTNKIDASFFERDRAQESGNGKIRFYTADLSWVADSMLEILDKVRVISPPELLCEVRQRLEKINNYYKG